MFLFYCQSNENKSVRRGNLFDLGIMGTLYSEFGASLGAATRDDKATFVASHAFHKSVDVAAFDFFWLVGAFHICIL